jgi:hypothetical protein
MIPRYDDRLDMFFFSQLFSLYVLPCLQLEKENTKREPEHKEGPQEAPSSSMIE